MRKYIDISTFQKTPDFEKVKGDVEGVILRAGYGAGNIDAQFKRNASECNRLGIPCGAYWFSYALTPAMARKEAAHFLNAISPYRMELPIAFDFEYASLEYMKKQGVSPTKALCTSIVHAFCQACEGAGYYVMVYANPDFLNNWFDSTVSRYDLWLAAWPKTVDLTKPPRKCGIWQWGASGIPGITTGNVDTDEAYNDYAKIIRNAGLNRLPAATVTEPEPEPPQQAQTGGDSDSGDGGNTDTTPAIEVPEDCKGRWSEPYIAQAMADGVFDGYPDGTFRPTSAVTREELAAFYVKMRDHLKGSE